MTRRKAAPSRGVFYIVDASSHSCSHLHTRTDLTDWPSLLNGDASKRWEPLGRTFPPPDLLGRSAGGSRVYSLCVRSHVLPGVLEGLRHQQSQRRRGEKTGTNVCRTHKEKPHRPCCLLVSAVCVCGGAVCFLVGRVFCRAVCCAGDGPGLAV